MGVPDGELKDDIKNILDRLDEREDGKPNNSTVYMRGKVYEKLLDDNE